MFETRSSSDAKLNVIIQMKSQKITRQMITMLFNLLVWLSILIFPVSAAPVEQSPDGSQSLNECENWIEYPEILKKAKHQLGLPSIEERLIKEFRRLINHTLIENRSASKNKKLENYRRSIFQIKNHSVKIWQDEVLQKLQMCERHL